MDQVILVDEFDRQVGTEEKLEAHRLGLLHRAFSVLVFDSEGKMLLQRRSFDKYHSGGLWTNTCCSHPAPGEAIEDAAKRRLSEEMGICCDLEKRFSFIYKAELDKGLTEYELDHVLTGISDETPHLNPEEAMSFKWMAMNDLLDDVQRSPEKYTAWFRIILNEYNEVLRPIEHESL
ncbi:MAG: isopentenyl-diphosphate Delta-isomerase [Bacteroidota bacterium]|jgi:isopentenyl-diphosphate delta-isomerase